MSTIRRPAGRYIPDLDVTVCTVENYSSAVIANLAANLNERTGRLRLDREPDSVGDCIVHDCLPTGNACGPHGWRVKLGDQWLSAESAEHAMAIVEAARRGAEQRAA